MMSTVKPSEQRPPPYKGQFSLFQLLAVVERLHCTSGVARTELFYVHPGEIVKNIPRITSKIVFVCVEVLRPSQPNGVMSGAVSLPNETFTAWADLVL